MKKLQNNFTTPEQSKRLLELGVPADSADCYTAKNSVGIRTIGVLQEKYTSFARRTILYGILPCWSVGRLIEISELCYTSLFDHDYFIRQKDCNTDFLIKMLELGADRMDFSKLEE